VSIDLSDHLYNDESALVLDRIEGVDDAGLKQLRGMDTSRLRVIVLSNTCVTGDFIEYLSDLPALRQLYLNGSRVSKDAPLDYLPHSLEVLNLDDTSVGDAAIARLPRLWHLELVCLRNTRVTDRSIEILSRLPRLHRYFLEGTAVTEFGRRRLDNRVAMLSYDLLPSVSEALGACRTLGKATGLRQALLRAYLKRRARGITTTGLRPAA